MRKLFFLTGLAIFIISLPVTSQTLPAGFTISSISSGWNTPVGAAFTPDGEKLFVWEKAGRVYVCNKNGTSYTKQTTPVINISPEVANWHDHGLLGLALDPNYATNGYIYLLYVVDKHHLLYYGQGAAYSATTSLSGVPTIGRLTRYQTSMNGGNLVADTLTRNVLIGETISTGIPILYPSHGIGTVAFASDGTLLVTAGDGANYNVVDPGNVAAEYYSVALTDGIIRPEENVGAFRSQLLNSHSGKLLRIDPMTGNGVPSNPFYDPAQPRAPKSRVWAMGFRNPFRMIIRPGTGSNNPAAGDIGEVFIGDVGWSSWEEVNIVKSPGQNFGWPLYEGQTSLTGYYNLTTMNPDEPNPLYGSGGCTQSHFTFKSLLKQATPDENTTVLNPCNISVPIGTNLRYYHSRPSLAWRHGNNSTTVGTFNLSNNTATTAEIGTPASGVVGTPFRGSCAFMGSFYTADVFPPAFKNTVLISDLEGGWIKRLTIDFTDKVTRVDNFATGFTYMICMIENPVDGSIVTVERDAGIKRIAFGGNQEPTVKIQSNVTYGPSVLAVNFTGSNSVDPDGTISSYAWDFGNGQTSTEANPSHSFTAPSPAPAKFVVKLTVTDNEGSSSTDSLIISPNNTPPQVIITSPVNNSTYNIGPDSSYLLSANVIDAEHPAAQLKYRWQTFLRHNNHQHAEPYDTNRLSSTKIARVGCTEGETYYSLVELTVTDASGLSTKDSTRIFPLCYTRLEGTVTFQGRPAAPSPRLAVPVVVDFYAAGNTTTPVYTRNVMTDESGKFLITDVPVGTYTISVKSANMLKRVKSNQVLEYSTAISFGLLKAGDVNNNNLITLADASILISSFNRSLGSPGYDSRADLNGDNLVSLADASILISNFNTAGEAPQ